MNLERDEFPLSAKYDSAWVFENQMGSRLLDVALGRLVGEPLEQNGDGGRGDRRPNA